MLYIFLYRSNVLFNHAKNFFHLYFFFFFFTNQQEAINQLYLKCALNCNCRVNRTLQPRQGTFEQASNRLNKLQD